MALGSEAFTILAVLAANDRASEIVNRVIGKYTELNGALDRTAETAKASGTTIDESLLATASGADALDLATARVEAAQAKLATATRAQADAEKELLSAQAQVAAGADGDAAAMDKQVLAADALTKAQKDAAVAAKGLKDAQASQAAVTEAQAVAQGKVAKGADESGMKLSTLAGTVGKVGLGMDVAAGLMVKSAADFQSSTTVLETSGGETAAELDKARQGILNLSTSTGTATQGLTNGLYMLGSAGFDVAHGGLQALQAAAQGAKAENADLGTVSNALSTVLTDYGIKVSDNAAGQRTANAVMDQMIAIVQNGKTTTEALAASLSNVLPLASSVGLSFSQVGGALATMTAQGMSADQASQNLANAIRSLSNPNAVAIKEMQAMGLNANQVSKDLGDPNVGLTGTIGKLTGAITAHMGPAGLVVQNAFQASADAAKNANAMIAQMPKNLQTLAQSYLNGSVTAKQWRTDLQGLDPISQHLMQQFAATADKTHTFNSLLASGGPAAQTYQAALAKMMGGATGLNVALMLGGKNMAAFQANVAKVGDASRGAGQSVDGWAQIQGTFNQKIAEAKEALHQTGIAIGTALLPAVTTLAGWIVKIVQPIAQWVQAHQKLAAVVLGAVAALTSLIGVIYVGVKAFGAAKVAIEAVGQAGKLLMANPWVLAIMAIALAAYLIVTHWSTVKKWIGDFWAWLKRTAEEAWSFIKSHVHEVAGALAILGGPIGAIIGLALEIITHWSTVKKWFSDFWAWMKGAASEAANFFIGIWRDVAKPIEDEWNKIVGDLQSIWDSLTTIWNATGGRLVSLIAGHWKAISDAVKIYWNAIVGFFRLYLNLIESVVRAAWDVIQGIFHAAWDVISGIVRIAWDLISGIVKGGIDIVVGVLKAAWDVIVGAVKIAWDAVKGVINTALDFLKDILKAFADLLTGQWGKLWGDVKKIFTDAWNNISGFFSSILGTIRSTVLGAVSNIMNGFIGAIRSALSGVWNALTDLWNTITGFFSDAYHWLWDAGEQILTGFLDGVKSVWKDVTGFFGGIGNWISQHKGPIEVDAVLLTPHGKSIMQGLMAGIQSQMPALQAKLGGVTATIQGGVPSLPAAGAGSGGGGVHIYMQGALAGAYVVGDAGMNQLVDKMGRALATKIAPQAGLRVAM